MADTTDIEKEVIDTLIAEAVGEGDKGLSAVAWTIINRANEQGKTPKQVVSSGAYTGKSSPGSAAKRAQSDPEVRARVERIWRDVSSGTIPDPTGGATHYWAPKGMPGKKDPYWADEEASAPGRLKIGNHVFLPKTTPNSALAAIDRLAPTIPNRRPDTMLAFAPTERVGNFSTETRYAPGAAKGATVSATYSPIRATASAKPILGVGKSASGSVNYVAPQRLTTRTVPTTTVRPGNTIVPTTPLEQLQLATERAASGYVPTRTKVALATPVNASVKGYGAPAGTASGSLTYSAPKPVTGSWGVGGANQAGTTQMPRDVEPQVLKTIRPQLVAAVNAQAATPKAVPILGAQKAASGSLTLGAPKLSAPVAPTEAMRLAMSNTSNLPLPRVGTGPAGNRLTPNANAYTATGGTYPFNYPPQVTVPAVAAIDGAVIKPKIAPVPLTKPAFFKAPITPAGDGLVKLSFNATSPAAGQNAADSSGKPVRYADGTTYYPRQGTGPRTLPIVSPLDMKYSPPKTTGGGLLGFIGGGAKPSSGGLFGLGAASPGLVVDPSTATGSTLENMGFSSGATLPAAVIRNLTEKGYI